MNLEPADKQALYVDDGNEPSRRETPRSYASRTRAELKKRYSVYAFNQQREYSQTRK
jgi:hypothetical protein